MSSQGKITGPYKLTPWAPVPWEVCGEAGLLHVANLWSTYPVGKQRLGAAAVGPGENPETISQQKTQVQEGK